MKKIVAAALIMLCAATLACTGSGGKKSSVPTLIWWQIGVGTPPADLTESVRIMSDYSEEKIGVRFEIRTVGWSWEEPFNTIVNSGEYFDLMFTGITTYNRYTLLGAFADITDLVPVQAPALWKFIPQDIWNGAKIKGRIYAVPAYKDSSQTFLTAWDPKYVSKYNINTATATSLADLDKIFRAMKAGEGANFYPLQMHRAINSLVIWDRYDSLAADIVPLGVRRDDRRRKVVNLLEQPDVLESLNYVRKWVQDGLINPDAPLLTEQITARPFFIGQGWPSAWLDYDGIKYVVNGLVYGPSLTTDTIRGSMLAISNNSRYKNEALKFIELINTDHKFRDMLAYGIEGKHFSYVSPNVVHKITDTWNFAAFQQGTFFNLSTTDTQPATTWDEVREQNEKATPSVLNGFAMDYAGLQNEVIACRAVWEKYAYDLNTGASDPAVVIPRMIAELKAAGFDKVLAEAQKQVDAFK
jgi:putative aldouronate transport system substrate-binding protein